MQLVLDHYSEWEFVIIFGTFLTDNEYKYLGSSFHQLASSFPEYTYKPLFS
jgi:hypothetical protein